MFRPWSILRIGSPQDNSYFLQSPHIPCGGSGIGGGSGNCGGKVGGSGVRGVSGSDISGHGFCFRYSKGKGGE